MNYKLKNIDKSYIFYKKNKTKRENLLFNHLIKKNKIEEFEGFVFESDFIAKDIITYKYNHLRFKKCIFFKKADFTEFLFQGKVEFIECRFLDCVDFSNSIINDDFLMKGNYFDKSKINDKIFQNTKVNCTEFVLDKNINLPKICKRKYNNINRNDFDNYQEYLISNILDFIARKFMDYGENLSKFFFSIISTISIFAFLYMIIGVTTADGEVIRLDFYGMEWTSFLDIIKTYIKFWYFSLMTFSTVGFGDMIINGILGQILVCIEVFIGITIQSIWLHL